MNDITREAALLAVMHLNDKSSFCFWGTVIATAGAIGSLVAAFHLGKHWLLLSLALWIVARFILMEKGMAYNRQAKAILDSIQD